MAAAVYPTRFWKYGGSTPEPKVPNNKLWLVLEEKGQYRRFRQQRSTFPEYVQELTGLLLNVFDDGQFWERLDLWRNVVQLFEQWSQWGKGHWLRQNEDTVKHLLAFPLNYPLLFPHVDAAEQQTLWTSGVQAHITAQLDRSAEPETLTDIALLWSRHDKQIRTLLKMWDQFPPFVRHTAGVWTTFLELKLPNIPSSAEMVNDHYDILFAQFTEWKAWSDAQWIVEHERVRRRLRELSNITFHEPSPTAWRDGVVSLLLAMLDAGAISPSSMTPHRRLAGAARRKLPALWELHKKFPPFAQELSSAVLAMLAALSVLELGGLESQASDKFGFMGKLTEAYKVYHQCANGTLTWWIIDNENIRQMLVGLLDHVEWSSQSQQSQEDNLSWRWTHGLVHFIRFKISSMPLSQSIAQSLVDVLTSEKFLQGFDDAYRHIHRQSLVRLCSKHGVIPTKFIISNVVLGTRELGHGAYGDVLLGTHGDRTVAVKRFRVQARSKALSIDRVMQSLAREGVILHTVRHTHVLPALGVFTDRERGALLLVTPWMKHGDIMQYLSDFPPPSTDTRALSRQIVEGMRYLHSEQLVHGDLKGANVLIDDDGRALVADFGLCNIVESLYPSPPLSAAERSALLAQLAAPGAPGAASDAARAHAQTLATLTRGGGTLNFMAPELLWAPRATRASDVWAFGMLMHQVHAGAAPYAGLAECEIVLRLARRALPDGAAAMRGAGAGAGAGAAAPWWTPCWALDAAQRPRFEEIAGWECS